MSKQFKLNIEEIKDIATGFGGCIATDMITVDGEKVGYMYRGESHNDMDSGWCFLSGYETQEYMDNPEYHEIYDVNTIANYDSDIIKYLNAPIGSRFERNESNELIEIKE